MNFYTNFSTGLIDGLLMKQNDNGYWVTENGKKTRNNIIKRDAFGNNRSGNVTQDIDTYLREWLLKQEMKPVANLDYDYEHPTPFDNKINKILLLLKWIIGIQKIKGVAEITKEDLKELDLDFSLTTLHKLLFAVDKCLVTNSFNEDETILIVKVGSRELKSGVGPGYVNMRISIPYLMDKITAYHEKLKNEVTNDVEAL